MTVWSKRKKNPAMSTHEVIEWMRKHTIDDLRESAASIEENGGDASSVKRLLTDLEELRTEIVEPMGVYLAQEEISAMPR